jgi:hypothetical protein
MRTRIPLLLVVASAMLMSGCDQNKSVTVKDKDGDVNISANGQQFHVHANDGKQSDVTVSGSGGNVTVHSTDGNATVEVNSAGVNVGGKLPGFVNIYPGAKVVSNINGGSTGNGGGTVAFETGAAPADVIGFYKQKASGSGFTQTLDANDAGSLLYSASSGSKSIQVLASKDSSGTHAQVTWSGK